MVVWEKQDAGKHYQLRLAGQSQRLYTNGVFHSQYRPRALLNGGVWDLLWLPLFFKPVESIERVLVLGLGSGAAVAKIHRFFPNARITALEIDRWHLSVARRFTGLRGRRLSLLKTDAIDWVNNYSGEAFDVVIDDLYGESHSEPCRAIDLPGEGRYWLRSLKKLLQPDGLLVANCLGLASARQVVARAQTDSRFSGAYRFQQRGYQNVVVAASDAPLLRSGYSHRLGQTLGAQPGRGQLKSLADMRITPL